MDALGARLRLMELADRGIDAQYFLIKGDLAGSVFGGELMRAADRGVRVRFLVDDVFTTGATAAECAHVLTAEGGAERVVVLTVARG